MKPGQDATLTVHKFELSPKLMGQIPIEERAYFLTVAHFTNELNILRKLVLISSSSSVGSNDIERAAQSAQSMLLLKLFAFKSYAAYEFTKKHANQPFVRVYGRDPDSGYTKAMRRLNRYFGGRCLLKYIRDKYVAHYDIDEIKLIAKKPFNRTHFFYLSEQQGNSLYAAAEEMLWAGIEKCAKPGEEIGDVIARLIDDVDEVAGLLTDCAQGIMISVGKRYAKNAWKPKNVNSEEVPFVSADNVSLPFFVNFKPQLKE